MSSPIRGWGLVPGLLPPGARNLITDVPGVTVGHWTLQNARHNTGLTVIVPRPGIYDDPCTAACCVESNIVSFAVPVHSIFFNLACCRVRWLSVKEYKRFVFV